MARTIKEASNESDQTDIVVEESNEEPAKDNEAVEDAQLLSEIAAAKQLPFIRDEDVACYTLEIEKGKELFKRNSCKVCNGKWIGFNMS